LLRIVANSRNAGPHSVVGLLFSFQRPSDTLELEHRLVLVSSPDRRGSREDDRSASGGGGSTSISRHCQEGPWRPTPSTASRPRGFALYRETPAPSRGLCRTVTAAIRCPCFERGAASNPRSGASSSGKTVREQRLSRHAARRGRVIYAPRRTVSRTEGRVTASPTG
jgi:hypothetical protein